MPTNFTVCPVCNSPPGASNSPNPPQPNPPQPNPPQPNPPQPNYNQNPPQPNYNPQIAIAYKSMGTTTILALVVGLFGICGIGHMYVGKVGKGIGILIGVIILGVIGVATMVIFVGVIFLIAVFILFIWQIVNARTLCREYNEFLYRNGRPPW